MMLRIQSVCIHLRMHEEKLVWDTLLLLFTTEPSTGYLCLHLADIHSDNMVLSVCSLLHIPQQSV